MPQFPGQLIQQLSGAFLNRSDIVSWLTSITDDFSGQSIDARWSTITGAGGTAASVAQDSPTRIVMSTGATCNTTVYLGQGSKVQWNVADKFTMIVRAKTDSSAPQQHFPIRLRASGDNQIFLGFSAAVNTASYILQVTSNSSTSTNVLPVERDDQWHEFSISAHGTTRVRARIDCDIFPFAECASNVPSVNLEFQSGVENRTSINRSADIDYVVLIPRLLAF